MSLRRNYDDVAVTQGRVDQLPLVINLTFVLKNSGINEHFLDRRCGVVSDVVGKRVRRGNRDTHFSSKWERARRFGHDLRGHFE